mmetsp:Transcript_34286/g.90491  ORF Transcript_34286/g.90491 Transcript_34286/m.90491 type:complete len:1524 (-) Transcript_34286:311-4882(-)
MKFDDDVLPSGPHPHPHPLRDTGVNANRTGPERHASARPRSERSWARAAFTCALLTAGTRVRRAGASSSNTYQLEDNFRDLYEEVREGPRKVYRSAAASAVCGADCDSDDGGSRRKRDRRELSGDDTVTTSPRSATCAVDPEDQAKYKENRDVDFQRAMDTSMQLQWSYADQDHWWEYTVDDSSHGHENFRFNECHDANGKFHWKKNNKVPVNVNINALDSDAYPGGSPIDFDPPSLIETSDADFMLSESFSANRTGLKLTNTGKGLTMVVCDQNRVDCAARATFGEWPKFLRGLDGHHHRRLADDHADDDHADDDHASAADEYYLKEVEFHWGMHNEWGSEHHICGNPRSGEVHFVMESIAEIHAPDGPRDAHSGIKTVILAIMLDQAEEGSAAFDNILDRVTDVATHPGESTSTGSVVLADLFPEDYATKFYTYAGGLTAPPCSQDVTWYVFENVVPVSARHLKALREIEAEAPPSRFHHIYFKAVIFPIMAILIGTAAEHWLSYNWKTLPYTVAVLLLGLLYDFFLSLFPADSDLFVITTLKESADMWHEIDGHVLLYAFLPALLFGDAMVLNTHHFQRSFFQCLLLACPGVIFGTFSTGLAAHYFLPGDLFSFTESMPLCLAFGSILAATDPVAVVAILKQLGASPKLTMQITGESLMNDGTALVIFNIFWRIYNYPNNPEENNFYGTLAEGDVGQIYWGNIIEFFLRMSVAGPLVGVAIGLLAYWWMSNATRKHSESDGIIQLSITVLTAYLSFFIGESECGVSGVLACVGAALVLARYAWPIVNSHEALESVWHALEYFGNTVIFFLTGVIIHRAVVPCVDTSELSSGTPTCSDVNVSFQPLHFAWMLAFFGVMLLVRCVMIIFCYPVLAKLGYGTSPKESAFMVWAGLRGAVGISLAILVKQNGGDDRVGSEIMFMVSGLAFLTLLVSGTTSGFLLKSWGMLGAPAIKKNMIKKVQSRVTANSEAEYMRTCLEENHDMIEAITFLGKLRHRGVEERAQPVGHQQGSRKRRQAVVFERMATDNDAPEKLTSSNMDDELLAAVGARDGGHGGGEHGKEPFKIEDLEAIEAHVQGQEKPGETAILRETFYNIVKRTYWEMIETGHLPRHSQATLLLLNSIEESLDDCHTELHDWNLLEKIINSKVHGKFQENLDNFANWADDALPDWVLIDNEIHYYLNFKTFEVVYYMCQGFCEAHVEAEHKLANYYGDTHVPDSPEEIKVCLESARKREQAKTILSTVDPRLVEMIKNNIVAENLLELEYNYIVKLINEGVLTEGDAEGMFHQIEQAQKHLALKQKEQGRAFSSEKEDEDEAGSMTHDDSGTRAAVVRSSSAKRKMSLLNTNPSIAVAQSIMSSGAHKILESGTRTVMEKALEKQKRKSDGGGDDRFVKNSTSKVVDDKAQDPHHGKFPTDLQGFVILPPKGGRAQQVSNRKSSTKVVPMDTIVGSPAADDLRDLPGEAKDTESPGGLQRGESTAEEKASVRSAMPSVSARETNHIECATSRLGFGVMFVARHRRLI